MTKESKVVSDLRENGFVNWYNFSPQDDILVLEVQTVNKAKTETESGIVFAVKESNVTDAPYFGKVVSKGPNAKNVEVGNIVFFPPQNAFPMDNIRAEEGIKYLMTTADRIDGILVEDIRK